MQRDRIAEIGIDRDGRLYVKPEKAAFPGIYREAMEVNWHPERRVLYSPKPREWTHLDWFKQIHTSAWKQGCWLYTDRETTWKDIDENTELKITRLCRLPYMGFITYILGRMV